MGFEKFESESDRERGKEKEFRIGWREKKR